MSALRCDEDRFVTVELPEQIVVMLRRGAHERGSTISEYLRLLTSSPPAAMPRTGSRSIFDFAGSAPHLRTGEDIDQQTQEEKEAWGDA